MPSQKIGVFSRLLDGFSGVEEFELLSMVWKSNQMVSAVVLK